MSRVSRRALGRLALGAMAVAAAPARGQSSEQQASEAARTFIEDLMQVAAQGDVAIMDAFLRERVETGWAFEKAFAPVDGTMSASQRERLAAAMLRFLAGETLVVAGLASQGGYRLSGTRRAEDGTLVEGVFRDAAGDYPFAVLVGAETGSGRQLIRDFGSSQASSVVARLTYATDAISQVSPDAEVWITAFERAVAQ